MRRILGFLLSAVLLVMTLSGCGAQQDNTQQDNTQQDSAQQNSAQTDSVQQEEAEQFTFIDALGRSVSVSSHERVGAAMGSFAEAWLLAGGTLAAATEDASTERGIELAEDGVQLGSLKNPSAEAIVSAELDLLLLSADISGHVELQPTLEKAGVNCAYFSVETFEDYLAMLKTLTSITGREDLYEKNGLSVQAQIEDAISRCAETGENPTVLLLRAYSSGVKAKGSDNMAGQMLRDLGCVNIADSDTGLLENLSLERILEAEPDMIFITTMGGSEEALAYLQENLCSSPAWASLRAVQDERVYVLEQALYHYKPNARWGESYEKLADILCGK